MLIPGALSRAAQRMNETATPLSEYINKTLGGNSLRPLGLGLGALTNSMVAALQKPGFRGFLDLFVFEKPEARGDKNKFTKLGSMNFTGAYPRELCNAKGREIFYSGKQK